MKRVGAMTFERRTTFPVSAGCLVANGIRETLAALLGADVEIRLTEPLVPSREGWDAIACGADVFAMRGLRSEAAIVVRSRDAVALAGAVFGEVTQEARELSNVERTVLDRLVRAIAPNVASVCGLAPGGVIPERISGVAGFTTYYELLIECPVIARIGIALAAGHIEPPAVLTVDDLREVQVDVVVRTEGCSVQASEIAAIELGVIVPITVSTGLTAVASVAGRPIARGECGVRGNRLALAVGLDPCTEGGSEPKP